MLPFLFQMIYKKITSIHGLPQTICCQGGEANLAQQLDNSELKQKFNSFYGVQLFKAPSVFFFSQLAKSHRHLSYYDFVKLIWLTCWQTVAWLQSTESHVSGLW